LKDQLSALKNTFLRGRTWSIRWRFGLVLMVHLHRPRNAILRPVVLATFANYTWDRLSPAERDEIVAMLPNEVSIEETAPEGDPHRKAKEGPLDALRRFSNELGARSTSRPSSRSTTPPRSGSFRTSSRCSTSIHTIG
jgi:hypothetical protein